MKTKFKYFTMAIVALLMVGVSSCSSDDTPQIDTEETKTVFLKISNGQPDTRADVPAQGSSVVNFTKGHIYFTDDAGVILRYHSIASTGADFTVDELTTGQSIDNLPSTVKGVYIIGNTDPKKATNISEVIATELLVQSQGDISNLNLYGANTDFEDKTGGKFSAPVSLAPIVARIELTDITATGKISSFEVEGVFVDNYLPEAKVDGTYSAALTSNGSEVADFGLKTTAYPEGLEGAIYDWYPTPLKGAGAVVKPTNVWAYNLFAGQYANTNVDPVIVATGVAQPRIIVRLKKVVGTGGIKYTDPQFITIKSFTKNEDGTDVDLGNIMPGNVYNIAEGALTFNETNLTPAPNMATIDVTVTVTPVEWNAVAIKPVL